MTYKQFLAALRKASKTLEWKITRSKEIVADVARFALLEHSATKKTMKIATFRSHGQKMLHNG